MQQKKANGKLIGGVLSSAGAGFNLLLGIIFSILGISFKVAKESADITVNGQQLTGQAAVEAEEKLGSIFLGVGVVFLVIMVILVILSIFLLMAYKKQNKEDAMAYQQ